MSHGLQVNIYQTTTATTINTITLGHAAAAPYRSQRHQRCILRVVLLLPGWWWSLTERN
jgi:hypothetical protein